MRWHGGGGGCADANRRLAVLNQLSNVLPERVFVRVVAWQYGLFEPELRRLSEFVPPGRTAVDVGGWWGPWSWRLAKLVPEVVTFEPNPKLAAALTRVLPANVRVHNLAASDAVGEATLSIADGPRGSEGRGTLNLDGRATIKYPVKTVALDDLDLKNVGFVKIDVEGHELAVLRGAAKLLRRDRPNVIVEIEERHHPDGAVIEVFDFFRNLDYNSRFLHNGRWHQMSEFDEHTNRRIARRIDSSGYLRVLALYARRYVNNFLFTPA